MIKGSVEDQRKRKKEYPAGADLFDPLQDLPDEEVCLFKDFGINDIEKTKTTNSYLFINVNLGDGARVGLYLKELYGCDIMKEWEELILVRFNDKASREELLNKMFVDVMLTKKLDRFYLFDDYVEKNNSWALEIAKKLNFLDEDVSQRVIRVSGCPRILERDCVIGIEDSMNWMNKKPPTFHPKTYSDVLHCVEFTVKDQKYIGYRFYREKEKKIIIILFKAWERKNYFMQSLQQKLDI